MFAAMVEGNAAVLMWGGFGIITVMLLLWMFYMMTFRTDDWLRLVKADEEQQGQATATNRQGHEGRFDCGQVALEVEKVTPAGGASPAPPSFLRRWNMLLIFLTFILTTCFYGCLLCLACRRITTHLQGNAEAVKAVTEHVLLPVLGRKTEQKPAVQKTKVTLG